MRVIPDKSVDMILCDLPYGTTACKWDSVIPYEELWAQYERIIKDNGSIVLTASQPFTSALLMSNPKLFNHAWYWEKTKATGHLNVKKQPLKCIEDILVFSKGALTYNPQGTVSVNKVQKKTRKEFTEGEQVYGKQDVSTIQTVGNYPRNLLTFKKPHKNVHPTQKPVALFEYLIRTYTNEGEVVLDNCIGSGTTAVAAINTGRQFIGIEREPEYVAIANERIQKTLAEKGA
jgi:site-specific DNA-methyltransferase (adenine-specific)